VCHGLKRKAGPLGPAIVARVVCLAPQPVHPSTRPPVHPSTRPPVHPSHCPPSGGARSPDPLPCQVASVGWR
jgi:hypothetical protein